jgi:hypothetical protein
MDRATEVSDALLPRKTSKDIIMILVPSKNRALLLNHILDFSD